MTDPSDPFVQYYAAASETPETLARFAAVRDLVLRVMKERNRGNDVLDVLDVGCGAGTQCLMWARAGHRPHGIDINESLIALARDRSAKASFDLEFRAGTATQLPWPDASMDVCLLPELLEHVADWQPCLDECVRVLKPGGLLYVSTTNVMCPVQQEFGLPLYSWYPQPLKRYWVRRALTDRPELVNHAKFPAVNWFSFYSLRRALAGRGFQCWDRFQVMSAEGRGALAATAIKIVRSQPPLRWLGQFATPYAMVVAIKGQGA